MKKFLSVFLALALMLAVMAGCGGEKKDDPAPPAPPANETQDAANKTQDAANGALSDDEMQKKLDTTLYVGCSVRMFSNPYLVTISEGCEMFCQYLDSIGQKYVYEVMLNEGSNDTQINQISAFLAKSGGNAILFCDPNEAAVCGTIAELVTDAGAYMCTTWNKDDNIDVWDYDGWVAHHSPDDVDMGYQIAMEMFSQFDTPYEGKIVCIQGLLGNTTAINRRAGLQKALDECPNVTLVADETANWSGDTALEVMETWLAAYDDINGVWCANDNMGVGAIKALEAKGLAGKVKVVGINAISSALDYIENGYMTASADCQGWQQGGYTLAICYDAWLGKIDVPSLDHMYRLFGTASTIINKENVQAFREEFYEKGVEMDFEHYWEAFRAGDYPV